MSQIKCLKCGGILSEKEHACPYCGAPLDGSTIPAKDSEIMETQETKGDDSDNRYSMMLVHAIMDYEKSIVAIILLCIKNLEFELGVQKLSQILTGRQTKFITDYELQNNPAFSLLKQYSRNDVKEVIEILEVMGYLQQEKVSWNREVLCLTDKAYSFLDGKEEFEGTFIDVLTKNDFIELDEKQVELYETLRAKRNSIADTNEIPAYTVCFDKTLRWMALKHPGTEEELLAIKGIGMAFIEKYGDIFLQTIKEFRSNK